MFSIMPKIDAFILKIMAYNSNFLFIRRNLQSISLYKIMNPLQEPFEKQYVKLV